MAGIAHGMGAGHADAQHWAHLEQPNPVALGMLFLTPIWSFPQHLQEERIAILSYRGHQGNLFICQVAQSFAKSTNLADLKIPGKHQKTFRIYQLPGAISIYCWNFVTSVVLIVLFLWRAGNLASLLDSPFTRFYNHILHYAKIQHAWSAIHTQHYSGWFGMRHSCNMATHRNCANCYANKWNQDKRKCDMMVSGHYRVLSYCSHAC